MAISSKPFGKTADGKEVELYELSKGNLCAGVITYGGFLRNLVINGRDVCFGFETIWDYENQDCYAGALVGRVCNRIAKGRYTLDGKTWQLPVNDGLNCLHSGGHAFESRVWDASVDGDKLVLKLNSPDGDCGFPGNVDVTVTYEVTDDNKLIIHYQAVTDAPTPFNMTNHAYFNLKGHDNGNVLDHVVISSSEEVLDTDDHSIPTGHRAAVVGTPFDFRIAHTLGERINDTSNDLIRKGKGYDHNFIVKGYEKNEAYRAAGSAERELTLFAEVSVPDMKMKAYTTLPGFQMYTGNYLAGVKGKNGAVYPYRSGMCLEAQNWPDAVNHSDFPNSILRPGEVYDETTVYELIPVK